MLHQNTKLHLKNNKLRVNRDVHVGEVIQGWVAEEQQVMPVVIHQRGDSLVGDGWPEPRKRVA